VKVILLKDCPQGAAGSLIEVSDSTADRLCRYNLARSVADNRGVSTSSKAFSSTKIIDAFPFFDELDVLEIRLNELDSIVDWFVIVESLERHGSNKRKPANLRDNWHVVKPFEHKIKYVLLDPLQPLYNEHSPADRKHPWKTNTSAWLRENYQRNALMQPVREVITSANDLVVLSDCDEIPRASVIIENREALLKQPHRFLQEMFYYNVNCFIPVEPEGWPGTVVGTYAAFQRLGFQAIRNSDHLPTIKNAGWHFSFFFGKDIDRLRNKIVSCAQSSDTASKEFLARDTKQTALDVVSYINIVRNPAMTIVRREADDARLPSFYLKNREKYQHLTADYFEKQLYQQHTLVGSVPPSPAAKPKIIDAFMFMNELDILDIRLHELDSLVDHFVILEPLEMYGSMVKRKPFLAEHWDAVKPFEHKIKYVVLDKLVPEYTTKKSGWERENFQRNALMAPSLELSTSSSDFVIVSDCDEIPRASAVRAALPAVTQQLHMLCLDMFFYTVNWYVMPWARNYIGTVSQFQSIGDFQTPRGKLDVPPPPTAYPIIPNAGWHFSNFCDLATLRYKVANFAHSTDKPCVDLALRSDEDIRTEMLAGKNVFHGTHMAQFARRSSADSNLPLYFLQNRKRFERFTIEFLKGAGK
jgi:beta-1,4-mannosyl-glycoprotein beta-1,4-N-acetylglucosaminyltransferase